MAPIPTLQQSPHALSPPSHASTYKIFRQRKCENGSRYYHKYHKVKNHQPHIPAFHISRFLAITFCRCKYINTMTAAALQQPSEIHLTKHRYTSLHTNILEYWAQFLQKGMHQLQSYCSQSSLDMVSAMTLFDVSVCNLYNNSLLFVLEQFHRPAHLRKRQFLLNLSKLCNPHLLLFLMCWTNIPNNLTRLRRFILLIFDAYRLANKSQRFIEGPGKMLIVYNFVF